MLKTNQNDILHEAHQHRAQPNGSSGQLAHRAAHEEGQQGPPSLHQPLSRVGKQGSGLLLSLQARTEAGNAGARETCDAGASRNFASLLIVMTRYETSIIAAMMGFAMRSLRCIAQ